MKILNTLQQDNLVYALLSDNRILRSAPLANYLCAREHAKQVLELQIEPEKLISWHKWTETEE